MYHTIAIHVQTQGIVTLCFEACSVHWVNEHTAQLPRDDHELEPAHARCNRCLAASLVWGPRAGLGSDLESLWSNVQWLSIMRKPRLAPLVQTTLSCSNVLDKLECSSHCGPMKKCSCCHRSPAIWHQQATSITTEIAAHMFCWVSKSRQLRDL